MIEFLKFCVANVIRNYSKYFLAIIGLVLGVSSIISMSYLGVIGKIKLFNEIKKNAIDILYVYPESAQPTPLRPELKGKYNSLKERDIVNLSNRIININRVVPANIAIKDVVYKNINIENVRIIGTTKEYLDLYNLKLLFGEKDFNKGCYIGYTLYKELFKLNPENVKNKEVNVNGNFIKVIGVLNQRGLDSSGEDKDKVLIMPLDLFKKYIKTQDYFDIIYVQPITLKNLFQLKKDIIWLLKNLHNTFEIQDFKVKGMTFYLEKQNRIGNIMVLSTLVISMITLLVGGIGVMAILLIVGIEEQREIGIKRAVGARISHIFMEFLIRSLLFGITGSLGGLIIGIIIYFIINFFSNIVGPFPCDYALLGIISSMIISILFGFFPAYKASKISPTTVLKNN